MKTRLCHFLLLPALLFVLVRADGPVAAQGGGPPAFTPASIRFDDEVQSVMVEGTTAYVGLRASLVILDVKNPTAPRTLGLLAVPVKASSIAGSLLYATSGSRLRIIDVSNPVLPALLSESRFPDEVSTHQDLTVYGNHVFLGHSNGLAAIDVSDPYSPTLTSNLRNILGTVVSVEVMKDPSGSDRVFAYLGTARDVGAGGGWIGGGFRVIDVTSPTNLQEVYPCSNAHPCSNVLSAVDVAVEGRYAYMVNDDPTGEMNGLYTLDLIDATDIRTLAYLHTPGPAWHVAAGMGRSHVAGDEVSSSRLYNFDVADKARPRALGDRVLESSAQQARLAAANGCVYVAEGAKGLTILCDTTITPTPPPLVWLPLWITPAG